LVVMLQAPGNRRLPVYAGKFDTPGRDLSLQQEEAPLFYGLDPNGTWVLWIFDTRAGEGGNLVSAKLHITAH
jgi:subtilisin-like proprotein convertase family protein